MELNIYKANLTQFGIHKATNFGNTFYINIPWETYEKITLKIVYRTFE